MSDLFAARRAAKVAAFDRLAQATFAERRHLRSALLAVAQYWSDEASDAVHHTLLWSRDETPAWPHACEGRAPNARTGCPWCLGWSWAERPRLEWADNGRDIETFAAFCKPGCHQEMEPAETYAPYAIARKGREPEVVGEVLQPDWLMPPPVLAPDEELALLLAEVYAAPADDAPRSVVADWLQDQRDPRGEFIARQLSGGLVNKRPPCDELWPAHQITSRLRYERGFPAEARVAFDGRRDLMRLGAHPAWATVHTLDFTGARDKPVTEAMVSVHTLRGMDASALYGLTLPPERPLRELQCSFRHAYDVAALGQLGPVSLGQLAITLEPSAIQGLYDLDHPKRALVQAETVTVRGPRVDVAMSVLKRYVRAARWISG